MNSLVLRDIKDYLIFSHWHWGKSGAKIEGAERERTGLGQSGGKISVPSFILAAGYSM